MLEKKPGKINVEKLRASLLLEEEFNSLHKIVLNTRVLPQLEAHQLTPKEIIGGRNSQLTIQLVTHKNLIGDMSNQNKTATLVISADASNFYDRVTHPFASLTAQYFGLQLQHLFYY